PRRCLGASRAKRAGLSRFLVLRVWRKRGLIASRTLCTALVQERQCEIRCDTSYVELIRPEFAHVGPRNYFARLFGRTAHPRLSGSPLLAGRPARRQTSCSTDDSPRARNEDRTAHAV